MRDRCDTYWQRFVAAQVNAQNARSQAERTVWLQVAETWLTLARAEQINDSGSAGAQAVGTRGAVH
jgi:hypothetical protein